MIRHSLLALTLLWQVASQALPPGSIQGVVTHWQSNDAVAEAIVELRSAANPGGAAAVAITATRPDGGFVFPRVAPGTYRVYATRAGYATGEYGRKRPSGVGSTVSVAAGEQRKDLRIEVTVGASVSGRITYSDGTPMPLSLVQSFKLSFNNGRAELNRQQSAYTNDLGEYRLFDLAPGFYYISSVNAQNTVSGQIVVNPGNARNDVTGMTGGRRTLAPITRSLGTDVGEALVTLFFPGSPDWEKAAPIEVRAGAEVRNINIVMIPAVTRTIKGVAFDADSRQPPSGTIVAWLTQLDTKLPLTSRSLQFNPDNGRFQFTVDQSGTFEVRVTAGQLAGLGVVKVNQADAEVSVPLYPPTNLSGSIRLEQSAVAPTPADLSGVRITLRNRSPGYAAPTAFVTAEQMQAQLAAATRTPATAATTLGSFQFQSVPVGAYLVEATLPNLPDAYVKSIQLRGENILNQELRVEGTLTGNIEILIGLQGGRVEGRAVSDSQKPVSDATVVLIPAGPVPFNAAQYRNATTPQSGEFQFRGLPPGEYKLYAWEDIDPGAWFNPSFMRAYESTGKPIRIDDGATLRADVVANPVN